jgi:hypothetical protein
MSVAARSAEPSPQHSVAEVCSDLGFDMLTETSELIESVAISTREAAIRRDREEVRSRLGHLRLAVIAMIATLNEMDGKQGPAP